MKKGEIYEGIIEKVDFPNKGRVQIGDRTVIVKNGMPGQKIRFRLIKRKAPAWRKAPGVLENHLWKPENRYAVFFRPAAAVCIRPCLMSISCR